MLIEVINTKSIVAHTAGLSRSASIQYRMVKEPATNWFAATNKHNKTYVPPRANHNASSTYLRQYPVYPFCQRYESCNLSQPTQQCKNDKAYHWLLKSMAPGPADLKADPVRINNPVLRAPPIAIIKRCLASSTFLKRCSSGACESFLGIDSISPFPLEMASSLPYCFS